MNKAGIGSVIVGLRLSCGDRQAKSKALIPRLFSLFPLFTPCCSFHALSLVYLLHLLRSLPGIFSLQSSSCLLLPLIQISAPRRFLIEVFLDCLSEIKSLYSPCPDIALFLPTELLWLPLILLFYMITSLLVYGLALLTGMQAPKSRGLPAVFTGAAPEPQTGPGPGRGHAQEILVY